MTTPSDQGEQAAFPFTLTETGGSWIAQCPKKLWRVSGGDRRTIISEAFHYFTLYHDGGEYAALLAEDASHAKGKG